MKNIFWLLPDRLAGRAGPTMEPWSLLELRAGGFDAVLNLSEFESRHTEFDSAELDHAWIPLPNHYPATAETETACLTALPQTYAFIRAHLEADHRVLVHCAWGRDRTGLVLAYYLARTAGISAEAAIAHVREVRPKAITAMDWEPMAHRLIAKLASTP
jgi:protein-tyrosine phosphatase